MNKKYIFIKILHKFIAYSKIENMNNKNLLGIPIDNYSKKEILEKIIKVIKNGREFCHVVSLNPENLVVAQQNKAFKNAILTAQIRLIDGIGIVTAGRLLGIPIGERYPGVDLFKDLLETASLIRLRVLLIGGRGKLADNIAKCYSVRSPRSEFKGFSGIQDINFPKKQEEEKIFSIVADLKPNLVFVAYGSPAQELWIERHKNMFKNCVCIGVGGGFDFIGGEVSRAPKILRSIGCEWLWRLLHQPWRWKRQLRLVKFVCLVLKQKLEL